MARGAGEGRLFEGRHDYIRGNTVSYYPLPSGLFRDNLQHWLGDFARLLTVQFTSNEGMSNEAPYPSGGGGGGRELRISSDEDDRMGAKTKTPKNPRAKN